MKNFLLLIFIYILSAVNVYAGGLSAWTEKTPYGNTIYHDGTAEGWVDLYLAGSKYSFKKFYFYKNHTIAYSESEFFIINEKTEDIQEYDDVDVWQSQLKEQKLVPFFKREYNANYSSAFGNESIFLLILFPFPFFFPIVWLVCLVSLAFSSRKFYGFRKHLSWIYPVIFILILIADSMPQSF